MQPLLQKNPKLATVRMASRAADKVRVPGRQPGKAVAEVWNAFGGLISGLAKELGVDPRVAAAIIQVESGGRRAGPDGRMIIRFEAHQFKKYLKNPQLFNRHFRFGAPVWEKQAFRTSATGPWRKLHTGASDSQNAEWDALAFARTLDDEAALNSISMGMGQVMGFNHAGLGYATVQAMFKAMRKDARAQIAGIFDYLLARGTGALNAMRNRDFFAVAGFYNGVSAQQGTYRDLMTNAYDALVALQASGRNPAAGGSSANGRTYTVRSGDSLSSIAKRFGTSVNQLVTLNQIANRNAIRVGQVLLIDPPAVGRSEDPIPVRPTPRNQYVVRPGDTLSGIAALFNTTVAELRRKNGITNPNIIRVGQRIKI